MLVSSHPNNIDNHCDKHDDPHSAAFLIPLPFRSLLIAYAIRSRSSYPLYINNNPVSSVNVKPSQPVAKNRLDLRNGDDDDSEVMISLR